MSTNLKKAQQIAEENYAAQPLSPAIIAVVAHLNSQRHYGYWQLCPMCNGWGEVRLPETSTPMFGTCPVCNGAKLLVRPEIKSV